MLGGVAVLRRRLGTVLPNLVPVRILDLGIVRRDLGDLIFPLPHHGHECGGNLRVEFRAGTLFDDAERPLGRPRLPIGAMRAQRVENITDVDEITRLMARSIEGDPGVPAAIDPDVVFVRYDRRGIRCRGQRPLGRQRSLREP